MLFCGLIWKSATSSCVLEFHCFNAALHFFLRYFRNDRPLDFRWICLIPDSWHWPWKHAAYLPEDFSYCIIMWWARYIGSFKVHDRILAMSMIIESIYIFVSCVCLLFPRTDSSLLKWWSEKVLMPEHPPWCMTSLCPSRGFFTVLFYALLRTYLSDAGKKTTEKTHILTKSIHKFTINYWQYWLVILKL